MAWWIWAIVGIALCLFEITFTPGVFVFLFFGISGFVLAALAGAGIAGPFWLQLSVFAALAVLFIALFRGKARMALGSKGAAMDFDSFTGSMAVARSEMAIGQTGKVEFRGTSWNALNTGSRALYPGDECRIEAINGLQLSVKQARD